MDRFGTFPFQVALLAAFCGVVFTLNHDWLLDWCLDGSYVLANVKAQFEFGAWSGLEDGWNPLQSLGASWYPFKAVYFPELWAAWLADRESPSQVVLMTVSAVELFAATWFLARSVRASPSAAALAGWLVIIVAYPLWPHPLVYPIMPLAPQTGAAIAVAAIAIGACYRMARGVSGPLWAVTFALCSLWLTVALTLALLILVPALLGFSCASLLEDRRDVPWRLGGLVSTAVLLLAVGAVPFVLATLLNSPAGLFGGEFAPDTITLATGALVFQGGNSTIAGAAAGCGALVTAIVAQGRLRRFALVMLSAEAAIALGSYLATIPQLGWVGIHLAYFEFVLWPAYAIVAGYALSRLGDLLWVPVAWLAPRLPRALPGIAAVVALLGYGLWQPIPPNPTRQPWPPQLAAIPGDLREALAIAPGSAFRGRTVNISGIADKAPILWNGGQYGRQHEVARATGNDHRLMGLWWFGVPTLEEYSSVYSPLLYALGPSFVPAGKHLERNIFTLGRESAALFPLFGVRTIVTDRPLVELGDRATEKRRVAAPGGELVLYDVAGANIDGYSPVETIGEADPNRTLARLAAGEIDPARQAILAHAEPGAFVTAVDRAIRIVPNGLELRAKSAGRSLLVLPFGYSHCWRQEAGVPVRLVRADGLLLGVVFEGALEATLRFRFGAFGHGECRMQDYFDNTRLARAKPASPLVARLFGPRTHQTPAP
ncbi:MAG: hypothetical protein HY749_17585 [Gammaproteobacteria bacterium]|nr:hypothetical protein [Gammaproteobacteria bacterium]MBI5616606.1 hypothetical protein [Gammaproteobacteria bacterium]